MTSPDSSSPSDRQSDGSASPAACPRRDWPRRLASTERYIGDVERGLRNIGLLNVDRIATALKTDLAGLMTEVEAERRR